VAIPIPQSTRTTLLRNILRGILFNLETLSPTITFKRIRRCSTVPPLISTTCPGVRFRSKGFYPGLQPIHLCPTVAAPCFTLVSQSAGSSRSAAAFLRPALPEFELQRRLGRPALAEQGGAKIMVQPGVIRLQAHGGLIFGDGVIHPSGHSRPSVAQIVVRIRIIGVEAKGRLILGDRVR